MTDTPDKAEAASAPVAYVYEIASRYNKETEEYSGWQKRLGFEPPCAGKGQRNVVPLYPAWSAPMPESDMAEIEESWSCGTCGLNGYKVPEAFRVFGSCYRCAAQRSIEKRERRIASLKAERNDAIADRDRLKVENERLSKTADRLARAVAEILEPSPIKPSLERAEVVGLAIPVKVVNYAKAAMKSYRAALSPAPQTGSTEQ